MVQQNIIHIFKEALSHIFCGIVSLVRNVLTYGIACYFDLSKLIVIFFQHAMCVYSCLNKYAGK